MTLSRVLVVFAVLLGGGFGFSQLRDPSQLPGDKIDAIFFVDADHGFIQAVESPHSATYETFNGGRTWRKVEEGVPGFRRGRAFVTKSQGWSIDENMLNHGSIYVTEDGGRTWRISFSAADKNEFVFGGLQAISDIEVWAVGLRAAYHTIDGGKTWEKKGPAGTGLQFLDAERGWIDGDKLWRTDNSGKTWVSVDEERKSCIGGHGFFFLDDRHGWSVSGTTEGHMEGGAETGFIAVTKDGGKTCERLPDVPGQFFWSVFFLNEQEGWVGGIGSLLKTQDGGHTWKQAGETRDRRDVLR
jgi:photosystem II stability/assembly factor-like uncharacterized protein